MAISTYAELQTAIADFLNRDDLTSAIKNFIYLGEAQISRDLRHWQQEKRVTTTLDERFELLPADLIEIQALYVDDKTYLEYISQGELSRRRMSNNEAGKPCFYTMNSNELEFYPIPDDDYELTMVYISRVDPLSDDDPSNWLLEKHPDIYLYAALLHTAPYLHEDPRVAVWAGLYTQGIESLNSESRKAKYAGPLRLRNR